MENASKESVGSFQGYVSKNNIILPTREIDCKENSLRRDNERETSSRPSSETTESSTANEMPAVSTSSEEIRHFSDPHISVNNNDSKNYENNDGKISSNEDDIDRNVSTQRRGENGEPFAKIRKTVDQIVTAVVRGQVEERTNRERIAKHSSDCTKRDLVSIDEDSFADASRGDLEKRKKQVSFVGVEWVEKKQMYRASITIPSQDNTKEAKKGSIGLFKDPSKAAFVYDVNAFLRFGPTASLNFGIPKRFVRAGGNVMFVPGPNKWFLRFKTMTHNIAIGYFNNAGAAESAYEIVLDAYTTGSLQGLNAFRSFLFAKCFEGTALAPWSKDTLKERGSDKSTSPVGESFTKASRFPTCMLCCSRPGRYVTLPCAHIDICVECKSAYESPDPEISSIGRVSTLSRVRPVELQCPLCQFFCIIGLRPGTTSPIANPEGFRRPILEPRAPIFRFPRALKKEKWGYIIDDPSFKNIDQDTTTKAASATAVLGRPLPKTTGSVYRPDAATRVMASFAPNGISPSPSPQPMLPSRKVIPPPSSCLHATKFNPVVSHFSADMLRSAAVGGFSGAVGVGNFSARSGYDASHAVHIPPPPLPPSNHAPLHGIRIPPSGHFKSHAVPVVPSKKSSLHLASGQVKIKSLFRGVSWDKRKRKWKAQIGYNGQTMYLGHFAEEFEAALAYDMVARRLHKTNAKVNFDVNGYRTLNYANRTSSTNGSAHQVRRRPPQEPEGGSGASEGYMPGLYHSAQNHNACHNAGAGRRY